MEVPNLFPSGMTSSSSIPSSREKLRARRCLFGKPEPKEVDKWLNECQTQMAQRAEEASTKWSFDFTRERPIDQPGPSPRIEYEAIPAEKESDEEVKMNDGPSTSNGRSMREKRKEKETKETNLRQARITNYLALRKRPSQEKESKGTEKYRRLHEIGSSASSPSPAPPSPFRFADDSNISMKNNSRKRITRAVSARNL
uniref:CDI domain-containing protein n=1 Tax=Pristionchus pacificus TaxID=54126 RepID=A0A2A6BZ33_PRIPA|eukprot:PDM71175.1 hypothetical protein PRIPAC_43558 [Pristionchus pacificus]